MARRAIPEIPSGSMADIAFLLLVFWLMTTTLDEDIGIMRQLPPIEEEPEDVIVKEKNVFEVMVNFRDDILIEKELGRVSDLKKGAMKFLTNTGVFKEEPGDPDLTSRTWVRRSDVEREIAEYKSRIQNAETPEHAKNYQKSLDQWQSKLDAIKFFGEYRELVPAAVISLQNDKGTSYEMYIEVQNELTSAVNQLRDDLSVKYFNKKYSELDEKLEKDKIKAIQKIFPQRISEAEPKDVGI